MTSSTFNFAALIEFIKGIFKAIGELLQKFKKGQDAVSELDSKAEEILA